MRHGSAMVILALALAACASTPPPPGGPPLPIEQEAITYRTSRCFGACPVYSVTVRPDGSGTFVGEQFTAATGTRTLAITPDQYRRFAAALAPYRPAQGDVAYRPGQPNCEPAATDMPGVEVTWSSNTGAADQHLFYYFGCRMEENRAMADALRRAPEALPLAPLIGSH